ncbi:MAG: hypothetical protein ACFFCS_25010 [Candidatus Hodarchaeota archaeon]
MESYIKKLKEFVERSNWLRDNELFLPEHFTVDLERLKTTLDKLWRDGYSLQKLVEGMRIRKEDLGQLKDILETVKSRTVDARALYNDHKEHLDGISEIIDLSLTLEECTEFVVEAKYEDAPLPGVEVEKDSFHWVSEEKVHRFIELLFVIFQEGIQEERISKKTPLEESFITHAKLASLMKDHIIPYAHYVESPQILEGLKTSAKKLRVFFRAFKKIKTLNFLKERIQAAEESLLMLSGLEEIDRSEALQLKDFKGNDIISKNLERMYLALQMLE